MVRRRRAQVGKPNKEINAALARRVMKVRLANLGGAVLPLPPLDFSRLFAAKRRSGAR